MLNSNRRIRVWKTGEDASICNLSCSAHCDFSLIAANFSVREPAQARIAAHALDYLPVVMNNYSGTVSGMMAPGGQISPFVSPLPVPAPFQSPLPPSTSSLPP